VGWIFTSPEGGKRRKGGSWTLVCPVRKEKGEGDKKEKLTCVFFYLKGREKEERGSFGKDWRSPDSDEEERGGESIRSAGRFGLGRKGGER